MSGDMNLISIEDVDLFQWDEAADVVVAGYGGAGICAALELIENGASVIAIDRFNGGGTTAFSGGVVYAGGTDIQRQNGIEDDADNMARYLRLEVGDIVKPETLKRFCEDSAGNLEWLRAHGVKFGTKLYTGKTTYPPEGYFLQYSGNEKVEEYCRDARPAPRGPWSWEGRAWASAHPGPRLWRRPPSGCPRIGTCQTASHWPWVCRP